jgi:predicted XRE-type DNA-binding protein
MAVRKHRASGQVFMNLGYPKAEAARLSIRSDLMIRLTQRIKELGLTKKQAADWLDVTQDRINDLLQERVEMFSIDTLVEMLERLGMAVTVKTRRRPHVA